MPALRALERPPFALFTTLIRSPRPASTPAVSSVLPSFTTMSSKSRQVCASTESIARRTQRAPLYTGMTTLAASGIAEPPLQGRDRGQDALDRFAVVLLPLLLLRRAAHDAGRLQVRAARVQGPGEGKREPLEQAAEHLHRALEQVLVAQLDPALGREIGRASCRERV